MHEEDARDRRPLWWLAALSLLTLVLTIAVPLAPVTAEEPVVSWPRSGEPAQSTDLPLVPYRPLSLDATVPCAALRDGGDVLRTLPPTTDDEGLRVRGEGGRVIVVQSGVRVLDEPVPTGDCAYLVRAGEERVTVERDGAVVAAADVVAPQVAQLATETPGAPGLGVTLRPDDRYASSPTALKTVLLVAQFLALLATLALAFRVFRGRRSELRLPRPGIADGVLVVVAVAWAVLGPMNFDDSWYALMASGASDTGYVGNQIYMFNVSENPFVGTQYLARFWGEIGNSSLFWLRLLPVLYGIGTWVLLRIFLEAALGRGARVPTVPWALLLAFLLWWLPYGITLRPEPFIVLCSAAVLLLADLARRQESIAMLIGALVAAALAVTASPSGIVAGAPLVLVLPWVWAWLRDADWSHRFTAVLAGGAGLTVVTPIAFADASLGDVLDAARTHNWYYVTRSWYEEIDHYDQLLRVGETGSFGLRAPVLFTLVVLVLVAIGSGRGARPGDPLRRLMLSSAVVSAVALLLLAPTPTKWVNHFGAAAAAPTVLLAVALLRTPIPRRSGQFAVLSGVLLTGGAAAVAFAGPNIWRPWTDFGMPFGNRFGVDGPPVEVEKTAPHLGDLYLRNPAVWLVIAAGIWLAIRWWHRRGRSTSVTVDRGVLLTATAGVVALMLLVFVVAPVRQSPGFSVAKANLKTVGGDSCGLENYVDVALSTGEQLGPPVGTVEATGSFALSLTSGAPLSAPHGGPVWHDAGSGNAADDGPDIGTLITPWWTLPGQRAPLLLVPVAAGDLNRQRVSVEIATGPGAPQPNRRIDLPLERGVNPATWQQVPVDPGPDARAVRLVLDDRSRGSVSWLAVSVPVLADWRPVDELVRDRPVYSDKLSTPLWPCVDQIGIEHGIHGTPEVLMSAADGIFPPVLNNAVQYDWGGAFVNVDRTTTYVEVPSTLDPAEGTPIREWGRIRLAVPDHPVGLVDLRVEESDKDGWERGPSLARDEYVDRPYVG